MLADPPTVVHSTPVDWQQRLWLSRTPKAVVEVVQEHVAKLPPDDLASLPSSCRPVRIDTAEDVGRYAFHLVSERCGSHESGSALHHLAAFFSAASTRIAQLMTY
jgi:hypothetical protein